MRIITKSLRNSANVVSTQHQLVEIMWCRLKFQVETYSLDSNSKGIPFKFAMDKQN